MTDNLQSLGFALVDLIESGSPNYNIGQCCNEIIRELGGMAIAEYMTPGDASIYILALMLRTGQWNK